MKSMCTNCAWISAMVATVAMTAALANADGTPKELSIAGAEVFGGLGNANNTVIKHDFGGPIAITGIGWDGSYCTRPGTIHWVSENRIAVGEQGEPPALFLATGGPNNTSACPNCVPLSSGGVLKVQEFGACAIPVVSGVVELQFFTTFASQPPAGEWCKNSGLTIQYVEIEAPAAPCPWDLNNDGEVETLDLLAILDAWGPNPGHPADFNGDDEVDVLDLLALLDNWGPCPPGSAFTGACCFGDAQCDQRTEAECNALADGIYTGDLCECEDFVCPSLPPDCPQGAFDEGETCGADINEGCNAFPDVYSTICCGDVATGNAWATNGLRDTDWYTLVIDEDICVSITLDHEFGAMGAELFLLNDDCGNIEIIAAGEVIGTGTMLLRTVAAPGTYRVFVAPAGFNGLPCPGAAYTLSIECEGEECQNDGFSCSWAVDVEVDGDPVIVNNAGYPASAPACGGVTANDGTVWFRVQGDGTTLTAHTCGSEIVNTVLTLYCDDCEFLADLCIDGAFDDGTFECPGQLQASYEWCTEVGQEYLIAVRGTGGADGDISLHVTSDGVPCNDPVSCALPLFCDGYCGDITPQGCWCDDLCSIFGDCCPNLCAACPDLSSCVKIDCDPCDCPDGSVNENETCGDDVNDGCAADPPSMNFHFADLGDVICGTVWAHDGLRDTDWYRVTVPASGNISAVLYSNAPQVLFILTGDWDTCGGVTIVNSSHSVDCEPASVAASLPPGTEVVIFTATGNPDDSGIFDGFECDDCAGGDWTYTLEIGEDDGPPPGSCEGNCGGGFGDPGCYDSDTCDCYCDEDCIGFGDCCPDACDHCSLNFCP